MINVLLVLFILILFIWYWLTKSDKTNLPEQLAFALIVAGGISNLADRIFLGFVRDFFDFGLGFTANLADLYVILGLLIIIFSRQKSQRAKQLSG
jgi:signal peptidase II